MVAPLFHFLRIRHTKIKRPNIDVFGNWSLAEEGRRKKEKGREKSNHRGFFYNFFSSFPFQRRRKRERHTEKENVNHLA